MSSRTRKSKFEDVPIEELLRAKEQAPPAYVVPITIGMPPAQPVPPPQEELIPLDQLQKPLIPKVGLDARSDGLAREPSAPSPANMVPVTVEGAAPPQMPLKLVSLLSA